MNEKNSLRYNFVGMAFAFALAQVGIEAGEIFALGRTYVLSHLYLLTHILLGTYIIAASWVGWQRSKSYGNRLVVDSPFSIPFIVLLLDIFLVICYFILVKSIEKPVFNYEEGKYIYQNPTAKSEAFWTIVIFGGYILWDVFTKLLKFEYKQINDSFYNINLALKYKDFLKRVWPTFVCLLLTLLIYFVMKNAKTSLEVILTDIALFTVFVLFRGFKHRFHGDYKLNKDQVIQEEAEEIFSETITEIRIKDKNYYWKIIVYRGVPVLILLVCIIIFLILRADLS